MKKSNISGTGDRRRVNPDWFTGPVWMKVISEKIGSKDQDIYHVHFDDGSRTKLHLHNGNQVLIVTGGRGSLEIFEREGSSRTNFGIRRTQRIALRNGDVVHIPSKTLHTHGSTYKGETFSHIALNVLPKRGAQYQTVWHESDFKAMATGII